MRTSFYGGADCSSTTQVVDRARHAHEAGWSSIWFSQGARIDVLTAIAVALNEVPSIHIGSAVVPIQGRHPIPMAQQALTISSGAGSGRFSLGLGVTHAPVSEGWYAVPYSAVVDQCAEHLEALGALFDQGEASVEGRYLTARASIQIDALRPRLLLGALAPRMLALAGQHTEGTVTWMTGPNALRDHVVPQLRSSANAAGRAAPEVVVGLPVCVTDRPERARNELADSMARTAKNSAYRRMVALEGVDDAVDLAIIGSSEEVRERIEVLASVGATELLANLVGNESEMRRTSELLAAMG